MSCQLAPLSCCACQCDPSVTINLGGSGGGGMGGDEDPNDAGIVPVDPSGWVTYHQTVPGTAIIDTEWVWNPNHQTWV